MQSPRIETLHPSEGPFFGGFEVRIRGAFLEGNTLTEVAFGVTRTSDIFIRPNGMEMIVTVPQGPGVDVTVPVSVHHSVSSSNELAFTYTAAPPRISGVAPMQGKSAGGDQVTITGSDLSGATAVTFGTKKAANVTVNGSGTRLTATSPSGPGPCRSVRVSVTARGSVSNEMEFVYLAPPPGPAPIVLSMAPQQGPVAGGTPVVINGVNFGGVTMIKFGDIEVAEFFVNAAGSQLKLTSPPGATGSVPVLLTAPGGTGTVPFTYVS